ncbi:Eyes absent-like protein 4 [Nymphaea thermarum]|nr:Eyes absent-like protein 4 [Nymphaea thermarum]
MAQASEQNLPEGIPEHLADAQDSTENYSLACHSLCTNGFSKMEGNGMVDQKRTIYVWDMDETLILLKSLLNGTYGEAFNGSKDIQKGMELGKCWEKHILHVCDSFFFYEQVEDFNEPFLDSLSEYDDGRDLSDYDFNKDGFSHCYDDANKKKLAYRYRIIAKRYAQGLHEVLDQETIKLWDDLYDLTDSYTDGWLSSARTILAQCRENVPAKAHLSRDGADIIDEVEGRCVNVLVTSGALIPSLVKCLLFRLNDFIPARNVYSSWDVGKPQCFSWIKARFSNPHDRFCVIGNGIEECQAAETMNWPFVEIDMRPTGDHRFPGLSMRTVKLYIEVVYGISDAENDE